jgi:hypothetical protein
MPVDACRVFKPVRNEITPPWDTEESEMTTDTYDATADTYETPSSDKYVEGVNRLAARERLFEMSDQSLRRIAIAAMLAVSTSVIAGNFFGIALFFKGLRSFLRIAPFFKRARLLHLSLEDFP